MLCYYDCTRMLQCKVYIHMPACLHAKGLSQYLPLEAPQTQQLFVNFHYCSLLVRRALTLYTVLFGTFIGCVA